MSTGWWIVYMVCAGAWVAGGAYHVGWMRGWRERGKYVDGERAGGAHE